MSPLYREVLNNYARMRKKEKRLSVSNKIQARYAGIAVLMYFPELKGKLEEGRAYWFGQVHKGQDPRRAGCSGIHERQGCTL
jgi:hypothetical protein